MDPCSYNAACASSARCRAVAHRSQCYCPPGTQGNPLEACVTVGCQSNDDCAQDEACDAVNRVCRQVCTPGVCAPEAFCEGRNHLPICTCRTGTTGDPYVRCREEPRQPITPTRECEEDANCRSHLTCVNNICVNPCSTGSPCSPSQECRVLDTSPFRSVVCQCPPDTTFTKNGLCVKIVTTPSGCKSDGECGLTERCSQGRCVDACQLEACGVNAVCKSVNHQGICSCPPGYQGNPRIQCNGKFENKK